MMDRQHKLFSKRAVSMMFSVLLLSVMLLSPSYLAKERDHDCQGDDCSVCCFLARVEKTMRDLASGVSESIARIIVVLVLLFSAFVCRFIFFGKTPVANKVRLNN